MQDEKIENQLNMALEATPDERERSHRLIQVMIFLIIHGK